MPRLSVVSDNTRMPVYSAMCSAILECRRVDEVAKLQDDIKRQLYGQQVKDGNTMKQALNEIYLRAERQLGELLAVMPKSSTRSRYDTRLSPAPGLNPESKQEALAKNNISRQRASRAERIARIPKEEFEVEVVKPKASIRSLSDYAKTREPPRPQKPKPKWSDPHLDAQIKLVEALRRVSEGLKQAVFGLKIKDVVLEVMSKQETDLPVTVNNELRKIKKQMELLSGFWVPLCPCPYRNQKLVTNQVKDTIDA